MDRISQLPDEIILQILSLLPTAKDVVATMVLSKRWQFLWLLVPKLVYDDSYKNPEYGRFSRFVERSWFMHKAPVLETLCFKLGRICGSGDIGEWIRAANKRSVHELIIEVYTCSSNKTPVTLPWSLYSGGYRMLVTLKLSNSILVDASSPISFPSLKKLSLKSMKYPSDEFVTRLLSNCRVLEDLFVEQCEDDNVTIFTVIVPSLKSLVMKTSLNRVGTEANGFSIDAPSLEFLNIFHSGGFCVTENSMTKILDANVVVKYWRPWKKFGSITTVVKRLYLCIPISKDVYPVGSRFCCLVHLKICTCETEWLNLLMRMLKDSPNLQALKLDQCHILRPNEARPSWNSCWSEPSSVPECLSSSLKTFKWVCYEGKEEEKEVVAFILRSGSCLKKATIIISKSIDGDKKLEMRKDLLLSSRRSPTCRLAFN